MTHVVAIGNFDGVHRGHRALIAHARSLGTWVTVLTFSPHPRQLFRPEDPPFRLTDDAHRAELLMQSGASYVVTWTFDWALAKLSPQEFIDRLVAELKPDAVAVGSDFAFGHHRTGTIETLHQDGRFAVHALPLLGEDGAISSSRVREALRFSDIDAANALLDWPWEIRGVVQTGDQRGRTIGFPTANISLGQCIAPAFGVYAVEIDWGQGFMPAVANIGIRPTFELKTPLIEAHVLDFSGDLYDLAARVRLIKRQRPEYKFESLEALKKQIALDVESAKSLFAK